MDSLNKRDFDLHPYSKDESRVAAWFSKRGIGGGDDPIGSLIASHELVLLGAARLRAENERISMTLASLVGIDRLRASNAELLAAAIAFESNLSDYCDGPERDRLRAVIARAKGEQS